MNNNQFQANLISNLLLSLEEHQHVFVKFRTKSGDNRTMTCTRKLEHIPKDNWNNRFDPQLNRKKIVCIYDWDNSGWRAFRKDSVISFSYQQD